MASYIFDLGETEHELPRGNLKLLTRPSLQLTLPHSSVTSQSLHELITGGLWITRGNELCLAIRIEGDALAGVKLRREDFLKGLGDVLCTAKVIQPSSVRMPND